ncbi:MAG: glycoside hydrolase family 9 protein [Sedimentisphaerales bacterium]|nr:glycoside hydrolase family 9 protein [Sedimentisphaerales bacterium]
MSDKWLVAVLLASAATGALAETAIMSSQVGYDVDDPMRAVVRSDRADALSADATFALVDSSGAVVFTGPLRSWGEKWGGHWWIADFSRHRHPGTYTIHIREGDGAPLRSDPIEIGDCLLWSKCYRTIAFDYLDTRAEQARTGKGWRDCGSDLQEFSSHAVAVDGLCDLLELGAVLTTPEQRKTLSAQILTGCGYLAHLQDKAAALGLGDGAVVHEDRQRDVVTGNVAKAAAVFARVARLLAAQHPEKSAAYLDRAQRAFAWIEAHGPIVNAEEQVFFPHVHGAPPGSVPPADQWMTRDLVTMARAAVELYRTGQDRYKARAVHYARRVMKRQVPVSQTEDGLYGHFYTYDDYTSFSGVRFTEKANIHCGAWSKEGRIYNKGGHYPHYLLAWIDMLALWPHHPDAARWRRCLHDFAYGYFLPACRRSPFLILPAGYYRNEGLLYFGSWYHGHNNIYAFAASLALEFGRFFNDDEFRDIAVGNLQWVAGLNCGLKEGEPARYVPVSMIAGIGARSRGSWTKIRGSICNGFSASRQFRIAAPSAKDDLPRFFDDEAYIAHSLPYLAALTRLEAHRP